MTNRKDNRVLCRRGARELTLDEAEFVSGAGAVHTLVCTAITVATATHTGPGDGDGCGDTDSDNA
jgi:hypothetical protein